MLQFEVLFSKTGGEMKKIVIISSCHECPRFDNSYYSYEEYCNELQRKLTGDEQDNIPCDCPLKDASDE